jgi:hypothetical protein
MAMQMEGFSLSPSGAVKVSVGPSNLFQGGRGLFLSAHGNEKVFVTENTILCGYADGAFYNTVRGDKCIGFEFSSITDRVVHRKKVTSIKRVVESVIENKLAAMTNQKSFLKARVSIVDPISYFDMNNAVWGHKITTTTADVTAILLLLHLPLSLFPLP